MFDERGIRRLRNVARPRPNMNRANPDTHHWSKRHYLLTHQPEEGSFVYVRMHHALTVVSIGTPAFLYGIKYFGAEVVVCIRRSLPFCAPDWQSLQVVEAEPAPHLTTCGVEDMHTKNGCRSRCPTTFFNGAVMTVRTRLVTKNKRFAAIYPRAWRISARANEAA
jgi:hypothetical protein